jgi:hypothetical protein
MTAVAETSVSKSEMGFVGTSMACVAEWGSDLRDRTGDLKAELMYVSSVVEEVV